MSRGETELTNNQEPLDLDEEREWFRTMSFNFGDITPSRLEKWLQEVDMPAGNIERLREEVDRSIPRCGSCLENKLHDHWKDGSDPVKGCMVMFTLDGCDNQYPRSVPDNGFCHNH